MSELQELWAHQVEGVRRALEGSSFGFFFSVGVGKSRATIEVLRHIFARHERALPTLILSPLITLNNWKNEILKFSKIPESQIQILSGSGANKLKQIDSGKKIIITNYETLINDSLFDKLYIHLSDPSVLICDESHYCKSPTAKRSKRVRKLSHLANYRYILSGTPILNNAEDIWSQAYILDHGERFEEKFHYFKNKYFYDANNSWKSSSKHFPNWQIRPESVKIFEDKLAEISMSVKKEDCLDLPPFIKSEIEVELSPLQKKHYEEVKKDFISYVSDEVACVATIAIVKALRLQEITSGYISLDNDEIIEFTDNPRIKALEELIDLHAPNHKIIVWACFKQNHKAIAKMLGKMGVGYTMLTGNESQQEKFDNMDAFEKDPKIRVCIGSQATGIGINLVESSMSIYYSRNFNLGHDIQSEARNYRAGSEKHSAIYRIDFVANNTLDRHVLNALADKKALGSKILRDFITSDI